MSLGMAWPEEAYQAVDSTWYLKWQADAEMNYRARKRDNIQWYLWFLIRSIIYGFVLFNVIRYLKRKVPRLLGYGPWRRDPNLRKLRRVVSSCYLLTILFHNFAESSTFRTSMQWHEPGYMIHLSHVFVGCMIAYLLGYIAPRL